jgi:hypothetical protein
MSRNPQNPASSIQVVRPLQQKILSNSANQASRGAINVEIAIFTTSASLPLLPILNHRQANKRTRRRRQERTKEEQQEK